MYTYVCVCVQKKKRRKKRSYICESVFSHLYEEGKEKEKMLFFFSAWRAVVHFEKAISEPAITIQKGEKREKEVLLIHELRRGKKRIEAREGGKREREKERSQKQMRERGHDDEQKHTRHP